MINDQELSSYYASENEIYLKVLDDVMFFLEKALRECPEEDIGRIYASSRTSKRVKTYESLLRKVRRDKVESIDNIPNAIEDVLGIRVSTPNKVQAKKLFDWLQGNKERWFCPTLGAPKFVPYTIEDRNKYSLRTGYQAYHVTFIVDREYAPFTANRKWPCELQIMSQVWEFWANYSRRYFYATSGPEVAQLLPYNTVISKILDSADDLMVATAELLLTSGRENEKEKPTSEGSATTSQPNQSQRTVAAKKAITADDVEKWLQENLATLISEKAKIPNDFFLAKIADDLDIYGVSLEQLGGILRDINTKERYRKLLSFSSISFLPVYQQILCTILLSLNRDVQTVVERVNSQLWLLGLRLQVPPGGA